MNYLLTGDDLKAKDAKVSQIKSKLFKDGSALNFDFELLDAVGMPVDTLKKALITLPVINPKRLVLVRNAHKLKTADAAVLMEFLKHPRDHVDIIVETSEGALKGELKEAASVCTVTSTGQVSAGNVFDMTKHMAAGRTKEALALLNGFYAAGTHPLQIMGGLVWFWGKEGRPLGKAKFEYGLNALEEADLNIKRSRLNPEYAVEKVVVELTELLRR